MTKTVATTFHNEAKLLGDAAKSVLQKSTGGVGETLKRAGVAFKGETTTSKLTIIGGISTGVTFGLTGLRSMRNGLTKDADGKRDYALAALGAAEAVGGAFVTALFWERLQSAGGISGDMASKGNSR